MISNDAKRILGILAELRSELGLPPSKDDSWKDVPLTPKEKAELVRAIEEVLQKEGRSLPMLMSSQYRHGRR